MPPQPWAESDSNGNDEFSGTWHITNMEMWDEDYVNREGQAYIEIGEDGLGGFQFGLVSGSLDGHVEEFGSEARFSFTWEGRAEVDPVNGSGWLRPTGEEKAEGMIKIHQGDRSRLQARRAS